MQARDIMVEALSVDPQCSVRDLAELLLTEESDGACVVKDGRLGGVVTTMDLVFQEKRVHLPSVLSFHGLCDPARAAKPPA